MNKLLKIITVLLTVSAFSQVFNNERSVSIKDFNQLSKFYLDLSNTFLELSKKAQSLEESDLNHYEKEQLFRKEMDLKMDSINNTVLEIGNNFKGSPGV